VREASTARKTSACGPATARFEPSQISCEIVALASQLLACMQMLAFTGHVPTLGAQAYLDAGLHLRRTDRPRRLQLRLGANWPWAAGSTAAHVSPAGCSPQLISPNRPSDKEGEHQGPWKPAQPARKPGKTALSGAENDHHQPISQASPARSLD
jgi:hypothetical protein